jgi:predicted small secreted protein
MKRTEADYKKINWTIAVLGIVALMVVSLTGCNTVSGLGTDITKSAEWTKDKMKPKTDLNQNK